MKILLIDPPYERIIGFRSEWYPLGLCSIAAFLIQKGVHDVYVYHAEHSARTRYQSIVEYAQSFERYRKGVAAERHPVWDELRRVMNTVRPDVVGVSVLTPKVPSALRVIKICKEIEPRITTVCGGYHSTVNAGELFADSNVDFVVRGEGEETFYELIGALCGDTREYDDIRGLSFKRDGAVVHNAERALINDLATLPLPARERLLGIEGYTPVQLSMVMTSRGCPYDCGFCASHAMWKRRTRWRPVEDVMEEIRLLYRNYKVRAFTFMDDSFTLGKERIYEFCSALRRMKLGITWSCLTRANVIDDEIIQCMKKAGCTKVDVGIESGNERVLELIGKNISLNQVRRAGACLRRNKMYWSGFFMCGFPTETREEIYDTLRFLKEVRPDWANMSIFTPYPGTRLFELAKEKGMVKEPVDYTVYSHQNPASRCTDTIPEEDFFSLATDVLEEVHRYNRSCRSLMRRALTRKYHKNLQLIFHDAKKVFSWLKR